METASLELCVPARAEALREIRDRVRPLLVPLFGDESERVILALDECCANVVQHRSAALGGGRIALRLEVSARRARFEIDEFCAAEEVGSIKPRDLDEVRPGGLGTHLVAQIMDHVEFVPHAGRPGVLRLVLEKSGPPPGQVEQRDGSAAS